MINIRRFFKIHLLHEGIIFIPFLIFIYSVYFNWDAENNGRFFNSIAFLLVIMIFLYTQICTLGLTVLRYFNRSRRTILLWSLLLILFLLLNQMSFYYVSFTDFMQNIIEGLPYAGILVAIQLSFQFISEFLCKRLKLIPA